MKKFIATILLFVLSISTLGAPSAPVLRKSPEFVISNPSDPSGKTTLLSRLKGKVVVLDFWFIQSDHCLRVAKMLNKLNSELASRGFQALGVVFDPPNTKESEGRLVEPTVNFLKLGYPVGYASKTAVDTYLGRTGNQILSIPQIVVIDRAGMIRAASGTRVDPTLEDENSLRTLLDSLLKESPPPGTPATPPAKARRPVQKS